MLEIQGFVERRGDGGVRGQRGQRAQQEDLPRPRRTGPPLVEERD